MDATNKGAVSKMVKAWEAKNDQRVKRAAGLGLMAVSLAACGGSEDDAAPTVYTVAQLKVTEALDAGYEVAVVEGNAGTFTVAELADVLAEIAGAANADDFEAEVTSGDITFSVSDSLANVDGEELEGLADLTVSIASTTAGADAFEAEIDASGTGTATFDFADTDDTVTLTGSLDGFTTVAVRFGTVDLTGVTLDDSVDVITVSSGVILTAAQFLALEDGITGGSADSTVQIVISDADEANAVIAAIANLGGSLDSSMVEFVASADSELTANALTALNDALANEMDQRDSANALPDALADLADAQADAAAHDENVAEFLADAFANEFVEAETTDQSNPLDGITADDVVAADIGDANDAAADEFVGAGKPIALQSGSAFNALTDAQQTTQISLARTNLQTAIDNAEVDVADKADALEYDVANLIADAELALATKVAADAALVLAQAELPGAVGAVDGTLSDGTGAFLLAAGDYAYDPAVGANVPVLEQDNVTNLWSIAAGVTLSTVTGLYTIGIGGPTVRAVELDALLDVLNDIEAADVDVTAAGTALDAAVNAAIDAQDPTNIITWSNSGNGSINNGDIVYGVTAMDDYTSAVGALDAAELALTEFEAAVDAWEATDALVDQLAALTATGLELADVVTAATAAIEDAVADGGLGIDIITANGPVQFGGPVGDDALYVFSTADASVHSLEVQDFGANGTDRIYFGEETYTFVLMGEDEVIADANGSASQLEIFAVEDATLGAGIGGVKLYIEGIASAGTGSSDADMTQIDLIGVDLADLSFNSINSILVAGEYVG